MSLFKINLIYRNTESKIKISNLLYFILLTEAVSGLINPSTQSQAAK